MDVAEKINLQNVAVTSDFWNRYRELVVKEVLPYQWKVMNDEANISIAEDPKTMAGTKTATQLPI